jgi:Flp pilus assembly protein TadB
VSVWLIIPPVLTTLGLGLLIQLLLEGLTSLVQGRLRRRLKFVLSLGARPVADDQPLSEAALYGLPPQLTGWMLSAAGGGLWLSLLVLTGPARTLGLVAGLIPLLWKRRRISRTQHQVRQQVAALIEDMRLRLAFGSTLGAVLHAIADEPDRVGVVYDRLRFHRDRLALAGPEDLLRRLAADVRSPELQRLVSRVSAARLGGGSYADALRVAADDVAAELVRLVENDIEGAPLRLLFPMLIGLLPPILVLTLYPPATALINSLTGAGSSGLIK